MPRMPGPMGFESELIYTIVIVILCFLIYFMTREMDQLTKHKGIHYFRNTFLFFGLAYASRFILHLIFLTTISFDIFIPRRFLGPIFMIPLGYFSTMAIFFLAYSLFWRKMKTNHFLILSNTIAIVISLVAFITRSHIIISILQLLLLAAVIIMIAVKNKKHKKFSQMKILYILLCLFWFVSLFLTGPRWLLPPEIKIILQVISVVVFIAIFYKVTKWIK